MADIIDKPAIGAMDPFWHRRRHEDGFQSRETITLLSLSLAVHWNSDGLLVEVTAGSDVDSRVTKLAQLLQWGMAPEGGDNKTSPRDERDSVM